MNSIVAFLKSDNLHYTAIRVALIYAIFSALWILLSDQILLYFVKDINVLTEIQMLKGWFFILSTAALIYFLLKREVRRYLIIENNLRESEHRFREMAELLPQIVFEIDLQGNVTYSNKHGLAIYGYTEDDIKATLNIKKLFIAGEHENLDNAITSIISNGSSPGLEFMALRRDGIEFPVLVYAQTVTRENIPIGIRGIAIDIADRKKIEEQLRQAQKLETVGTLAGGLAHDFNNLLTPIIGYTDLLLRKFTTGSPEENTISQIQSAALRAQELTRQLLAFGRKQILDIKVVNLDRILTAFKNILKHTVREDITVSYELNCPRCNIKADITQIEQIILNLVINAQDAMPGGGEIIIETSEITLDQFYTMQHPEIPQGVYSILTISDTGSGMDAPTLKRIFEPFFTTKEKGKGTGLGLATVHGIIRQHNGYITIYSEPGNGTSFKIYFPTVDDSPEEIIPSNEPIENITGTETILVVEDNELVRKLACDILSNSGYAVLSAANPHESIEIIRKNPGGIDLLLTDVIMPGESGKELFDKISQDHPGMKVIYMSGYTDDVIAHHGILDKNINFLQKPFAGPALTGKVRSVLNSD